jgi:hypothetical protein
MIFLGVQSWMHAAEAQEAPATIKVPQLLTPGERAVRERMPRIERERASESPFARSIGRAAARGWMESGVEQSKRALLDCQQETSILLTTPFGSSEAQQAHCYRF